MSVKVLLKEYPHRSIALVTSSHALVFQHSPHSNTDYTALNGYSTASNASYTSLAEKHGSAPRIMVEFSSLSAIDLHDYRPLTHPCKGTLGLVTLGRDVFLCLVSGSSPVATVRPGERVERIHNVEFRKLELRSFFQSTSLLGLFQIVWTARITIGCWNEKWIPTIQIIWMKMVSTMGEL